MNRHSSIFAWIAALGVLLHVGTAGASTWCKVMGLSAASCCQDETMGEAEWVEPSDCCRPALETPEVGEREAEFASAPVLLALPWDEPLDPTLLEERLDTPAGAGAFSSLESLSTIVINC